MEVSQGHPNPGPQGRPFLLSQLPGLGVPGLVATSFLPQHAGGGRRDWGVGPPRTPSTRCVWGNFEPRPAPEVNGEAKSGTDRSQCQSGCPRLPPLPQRGCLPSLRGATKGHHGGRGSWVHPCLMPTHTHRPSPATSPVPSGLPRAEGPQARPPTKLPLSTSPQALSTPVKMAPPAPLSGGTTSGASTPPQAGGKSSAVSLGVSRAGAGSRLKPEAPLTKGKSPPYVGRLRGTGCPQTHGWLASRGRTWAPSPAWKQGS